jgi:hypothetical protein
MIYQFESEVVKRSKFIIQSIEKLRNGIKKVDEKELELFDNIDDLIKQSSKIKNSLNFINLNEAIFFDKIEKVLFKVKEKNAHPQSIKLLVDILQNVIGYLEEKIDKLNFLEENDFYPLELWEDWRKLCYLLEENSKPLDLFFPFAEYDEYEEDFFGGEISTDALNKYIELIEDYEKSINVEEATSTLNQLYKELEGFSQLRIKSGFQGLFLALQGRIILALSQDAEFNDKKNLVNTLKKSVREIEEIHSKENVSIDFIKNVLEKFLILKNWKHLKEIDKISELNKRFNIEKFIFKTKLVNNQFFKEDRNGLYKSLTSIEKIIDFGIYLLSLKNKIQSESLSFLVLENHRRLSKFKKHFKYVSDNFFEEEPTLLQYKLLKRIIGKRFQVNDSLWEEFENLIRTHEEDLVNLFLFKEDKEVKLQDEKIEAPILDQYNKFLMDLDEKNKIQEEVEVNENLKEQEIEVDKPHKRSGFSVAVVDEKHLMGTQGQEEFDKEDLKVEYLTEKELTGELNELEKNSTKSFENMEDKIKIVPNQEFSENKEDFNIDKQEKVKIVAESITSEEGDKVSEENINLISDEEIEKNILNVFDENDEEDTSFYLSPFDYDFKIIIETLNKFDKKLLESKEKTEKQSLLISNLNEVIMDIEDYLKE